MSQQDSSDIENRFDARIVEHQVRRNAMSREDLAAWLAALPDDADNAVESHIRFSAQTAGRQGRRRSH